MGTRALIWLLSLLLCAVPSLAHAETEDDPVIVIGVSGLMWPYLDSAPNLSAFADTAGLGSLTVKTTGPVTCPVSGWLTLGSGERATSCVEPTFTGDTVDQWDTYVEQSQASPYSAKLGRLGASDLEIAAIGPRARLAAAHDGLAPPDTTIAASTNADLILIDLGQVGPEQAEVGGSAIDGGDPLSSFFSTPVIDRAAIEAGTRQLDERFGEVMEEINATFTDPEIYVVSLGDYFASTTSLQVIMTSTPGGLTSLTTRTDGLVHITDLYASLADRFGLDTSGIEGSPIAHTASVSVGDMVRLDTQVQAVRPAVGPVLGLWALAWFITLGLWAAGKRSEWALLSLGAVPGAIIAANLLPWYLAGSPTLLLVGLVAAGSLAIGAVCAKTRAGVLGVSLTNLAVITAGMFVPHLVLYTVIGSLPHTGRFYGMNNMLFAIFAVNAVLAAWAAWRRWPAPTAFRFAVVLFAAVILVDGWPGLGTDFGGPPVLVIGFGLILLAMASALTWVRIALLVIPALLVPLGFMIIDYLKPHATHIGAFFASILDGSAVTVIARKAGAVVAQWPFMVALAVLIALVIVFWKKKGPAIHIEQAGVGTWCVIATLIILGGGSLINDSGIAIIAMGCAAGLPLALSRR